MHQTTGRSMAGFLLALLTAILWGILPIALKMLLEVMNAETVTAVRFLVAALLVGAWLLLRGNLPVLSLLKHPKILWLMIIAIMGLLGNYVLYLSGLAYLNAEAAQMLIQLAPFLMMIGGIFIFKEKLLLWQKAGAVILVAGLLLFFNDKLGSLLIQGGQELPGVILVLFASITWAAYALAQKQLLVHYNSKQIMYMIYVVGALFLLPVSDLTPLVQDNISLFYWGLLAFSCLNTVIAYGAFAEALHHWEATKVSAVLAITPLLTIAFASLIAGFAPELLVPQTLNMWSWAGALMVVAGSAITALAPLFAELRAARRNRLLQRDIF
ncbi:DMT family transporter [Chromatiaceae bacterium AAb-1]|nr:DMT family transporter [Chromatiaceae bacterium AAb-1]